MDANFGLVHKFSSGGGHGRKAARHQGLYFLDHGQMKQFVDDYNMDSAVNKASVSNDTPMGSLPEKPVVRRPWPVKYWQDHWRSWNIGYILKKIYPKSR